NTEIHFFFQAEDGIRDFHVTGVQTCALPILTSFHLSVRSGSLIPRESPAAAGVVGTVPTGAGASAKFEFDRGQRLMVRMTRTAATRAMTTQIPPWRMRSIRSACPAAAVTLPPRPG